MVDLAGASVVVTGASSGIGRATARAFAAPGARLTLAARRAEVLETVARECRDLGGEAITMVTDVSDPEAVRRLVQTAVDRWGRIDVWVNNAGVGVVGAYEQVPLEMHRQVIGTNLLGAMHGAHMVLPVFLRQGAGILVNNVSIAAWAPNPFGAAYTASKFGLRGLSASLRQELQDQPDIHVCAVFPSIIDTPAVEHAGNLSGRRIDPGRYLYASETVAEAIVEVARHLRPEVPVGVPSRVAKWAYGLSQIAAERMIGHFARRALRQADVVPHQEGAVMHAVPEGVSTSGGWRKRKGDEGRSWILAVPAQRCRGRGVCRNG